MPVAVAAVLPQPSARGSLEVAAAAAGSQPCGVLKEPERKTGWRRKASVEKLLGCWEMQVELPGQERREGAWKVCYCPVRREAGLDPLLQLELSCSARIRLASRSKSNIRPLVCVARKIMFQTGL